MAMQTFGHRTAAVVAITGLSAWLAGCSAPLSTGTTNGGAALSVACEPNQRAIIRPLVVNGVAQSQVQCETVAPGFAGATATMGTVGQVAYQPGVASAVPVNYVPQAAYAAPLENTRLVSAPAPVVRQAAAQRFVTHRAPARVVQPKRSVKKSAIIIGSSAGVGAGIGAAVGGKKGAGIGALIGGGGAALWDQITRRKQ